MNTINDLKAALFDIMREQGAHQQRIQQLEQLRVEKLKELATAEQQAKQQQ